MAFLDPLITRMLQLLLVPYYHREVIWVILPVIFGLVMLQMYFGKHRTELLGWNTAFGNSISLMWVTVMLFRYIHENFGFVRALVDPLVKNYLIVIYALGIYTLLLIFHNYMHSLPQKIAFFLSSSVPTNGIAYFATVIVMGMVPLDWLTLVAVLVVFLFVWLVFTLYKNSITPSKSALKTLKIHEEEEKKKKTVVKRKRTIALNKLKLVVKKTQFRKIL